MNTSTSNMTLKSNFDELLDRQTLLTKSFDDLTTLLRQTDFITSVNELMNNLFSLFSNKTYTNQQTRKFLSSYVVAFHKEEVLNNDNFANHLFESGNKLVNTLCDLFERPENLCDRRLLAEFLKSESEYLAFFDHWKARDQLILIRPMIKTTVDINHILENSKTLTNERRMEYTMMKRVIRRKVKTIVGQRGLEMLDSGEVTYFKDEKVFSDVEQTVRRAFWDVVEENINNNNFEQIGFLLTDIKKFFHTFLPNREDMRTDIDEHIDEELVVQMLSNGSFGGDEIVSMMLFIIGYLERLQAPSEDEDTRLFKENVMSQLQRGEQLSKTLRYFFTTVFEKLEKIKHTILLIGGSNGQNVQPSS